MFLLLALPAAARKPADDQRFASVDSILRNAIRDGQIPGAVVIVGHNGQVVYRKAFGERALQPRREPMTLDTIFDIASLTKVVATAPSLMRMVQLGQVRLNDPVAKYLPEFARNGKDEITVRQLMTHFSGLREDLDLTTPWTGKETAYQLAFNETPVNPPGSKFLYSDINFIVVGALVERVSGMPLDKYADAHIFQPLKMATTRFDPPAAWTRRIAPTQYDENGQMLRGVVHDPTARRMSGVAGHAGLFSTGDDLALYAQALLDGKVLDPLIVEKMTTPQQPPNIPVLRGLGWDIDSSYSSNRGELLPVGSYGHTGFTGTSLWIDPLTRTYIIILTNAVHPRGGMTTVPLRSKVATAVADALHLTVTQKDQLHLAAITGYNERLAGARHLAVRNGVVETGIDVVEGENFNLFPGSDQPHTIGVLTNQTGVDGQGKRTIDVLAHAPNLKLAAIFSPEHGVTGALDTTKLGNTVDAGTGAPVYSVYGGTEAARRPTQESLKGLDAVVVDLQDVGVRFYTYGTTVGYFLEAAAQAGIEIIILDRPNPITGAIVQGPMSQAGQGVAFNNYYPVPVRHGMTLGELAQFFNGERKIGAKLRVIPMVGWMRGDWYDATNLPWINPSPNLRSLTEAELYPGVAMVEGTNVSVGRGTDTPFELLGAPWIDARQLASYLNLREIAGVRFVPTSFTPASGTYANQRCNGVNLVLTSRSTLDAPELGIELAAALRKLYPNDYKIDRMIELLANQAILDGILSGEDPRRIAQDWQEGIDAFLKIREKYLLYK